MALPGKNIVKTKPPPDLSERVQRAMIEVRKLLKSNHTHAR
jgi:hypothetical protein